MEDQGKRVLIAVVLCMAIVGIWSWWFAPKPTSREVAPPQATQAQPAAPAAPAPPTPGTASSAARGDEKTVTLTTGKVEAVFSSWGGALKSWRLLSTQYRMRTPEGKEVPMDLVRTGDQAKWYPLQVSMAESTFPVDEAGDWELEKKSDTEVIARWRSPDLEVVKRYRLQPDGYAAELAVEVTNRSQKDAQERLAVHVYGYQDPHAPEGGMFSYAPPRWSAGCHVDGKAHFDGPDKLGTPKVQSGDVRWTGMDHKYFLLATATKPSPEERLSCALHGAQERAGVMESRLVFTPWTLKPGDMVVKSLVVYAGPKILDDLEQVSALAKGDVQLPSSVNWGPAPTKWFTVIARPMLSLLRLFHGWVRNWGIAIIMLTIVVKLLTLYWTQKSMRQMKAMGKLKPKMDEIREKYANDKEKQNTEMMRLYKDQGINPLGGCLPMLLQMPIWMALYSALGAAAELYQAPFLGWIRDLTAPDPYYILPVTLTVFMFLQSKLSPAAVDSTQQKMMQYMMPLMFGFFSLVFPSGLTVYIFTNTVLSMFHQLYMNRTEPKPAGAAAGAAAPKGSGGGGGGGPRPSGSRPSGRKKK